MELQTEKNRTMDTNSYKKYIENSSFDERTKELFYKMLNYPKDGSKNLERFFRNSESNLLHWNERTDKEHAISFLIGKNLYGIEEEQFYLDVVKMNIDYGKVKAYKMTIRKVVKKDKTNIGMILWLIDFFNIDLDWDSLYQTDILTEDNFLTEDFMNILKKSVISLNEKLHEFS